MGTLLAVYSEAKRRFFKVAAKPQLNPDGMRRVLASPYRYCLGSNYFYMPADHPNLTASDQLCWARIEGDVLSEFHLDFGTGELRNGVQVVSGLNDLEDIGVRIGNRYIKRQKENDGEFVPVDEFCSQSLIDALVANPEALPSVSHEDFEALCAEIFVRRGFKVDLFRPTGDGGIDFLAVNDESTDPMIFAVQCKQPEVRPGKGRRSLGRPVVQQIYGAAKAWDLAGAIAVSGSTYSDEARKFANLKPSEIQVFDATDLIRWLTKYRWNEDEIP